MDRTAQRISISKQVLFRDLGEEAVILELESGQYYGLNDVGTQMWLTLQEHQDFDRACEVLLEVYEVPADELRRDYREFVELLASRKLLEIHEDEP